MMLVVMGSRIFTRARKMWELEINRLTWNQRSVVFCQGTEPEPSIIDEALNDITRQLTAIRVLGEQPTVTANGRGVAPSLLHGGSDRVHTVTLCYT